MVFYEVNKGGLVQSALGLIHLLKLIPNFVQGENNFIKMFMNSDGSL